MKACVCLDLSIMDYRSGYKFSTLCIKGFPLYGETGFTRVWLNCRRQVLNNAWNWDFHCVVKLGFYLRLVGLSWTSLICGLMATTLAAVMFRNRRLVSWNIYIGKYLQIKIAILAIKIQKNKYFVKIWTWYDSEIRVFFLSIFKGC